MPALLEKLGNRADFNQTIDSANFRDVISLVANELGASDVSNLSGPEIIAMLHQVVPENDYYAKNIDTTPVGEHDQFTVDQQRTLNLTLRGANATWMTTQIHRAAWEGATDRIDPSEREAFNPYDLMKQDMYQKLVDEGFSPQQSLVRVAFEVDKYRDVLKRTVQAKLAEVDSASVERHST